MGIPGSANPLLLVQQGSTQYTVARSLRFNSSDSGFCSRTPSSAGNRKTWTFSCWAKRSDLSTSDQTLFSGGTVLSNAGTAIIFFRNNKLCYSSITADVLQTEAVYRDASAWYHIVVSFDTTQATASSRLRFYVNGSEVTQFSTDARSAQLSQNTDYGINTADAHGIGRFAYDGSKYFNGYLAEIHFVDGQQLTPSSFTEVSATTGQLIPKAYTGSYGTNGFKLDFADNSAATAAALGKDSSGNGNNFTPNNLSVTAGAGNDSLVDTPTSYGTDTSVGGEVRGNYCTWNAAGGSPGATLTNGNLDLSGTRSSAQWATVVGTVGVSSGKWYWEILQVSTPPGNDSNIGVISTSQSITGYQFPGNSSGGSYGYDSGGWIRQNGSASQSYSSFTANDIIGVALDLDNLTLRFYKNNVAQGTLITGITATTYLPAVGYGNSSNIQTTVNFGQRPFAYTAPSGFKALCDTNLPAPVVAKPSTVFDTKLYTGNGSSQTITGLAFSPDFVWLKSRTNANWHELNDTVRGAGNILYSNATDAEVTAGRFTAFTSDGFSVSTTGGDGTNFLNAAMVGWCWDAGSSNATNTQGSITSTVRANASAGFSIVSYTGNSSTTATVGHGLGAAPALIICKNRSDAGESWAVYHSALGATKTLLLNTTDAPYTLSGFWQNTAPTSSVVTIGEGGGYNNKNGKNHIMYCFAPVAGYSSFGSYIGNGSSDGVFQWCGFRPRWVMFKRTDSTGNWVILNTASSAYNVADKYLMPNSSQAEDTAAILDILSNGFKLRYDNVTGNANGGTYVWAAFAESPFQYARAR